MSDIYETFGTTVKKYRKSKNFKKNQLKIDLATENIHNIDLLNNYITLIVETFFKNLSEYEYNSKAIEVIGNHLLYELDSLNKIKKLDRT
ncbi:hypothetical protein [Clostridium ganghwense]|uniref:Uncharacterized protein n=1 Tax=Clostridium ganghwense TaxID=312089 RepID=A0ABT4CRQ7_9CLOT|nr:hypothetical protein [Clostridium ganghwense]MCY6370664.1 hypothetical protein [Clostridium ganghwense]